MTADNGKQSAFLRQPSTGSRRQRRVDAFHPTCRRFIAALTSCSPELEDLADSFPGLLFALATGFGTAEKRDRAFELICAGAPLREVADTLGFPWWLRKVPAPAFTTPLPSLPEDPEFAFHVSSLVPAEPGDIAEWLGHVVYACAACDSRYALWVARHSHYFALQPDVHMLMAAWAWFGGRPGLIGNRLVRRPWAEEMSFRRAREELSAWLHRVRLIECLGPGIESPWLADGTACGFSFVALRTVEDFITESEALENCLDQYADQLHAGQTAVFSIRKGGKRVACVEIGLHDEEVSMPAIVQLKGVRNRRAPPEVWQATFGWLGGQRLQPLVPKRLALKQPRRLTARRQLWGPYLTFLEGSGHQETFRRRIMDRAAARGVQRAAANARPRLGPRRLAR